MPFKKVPKKKRPKWRAKWNGGSEGSVCVFVWTLGKEIARVSEEIDSERFQVTPSNLSSFVPVEKSWT